MNHLTPRVQLIIKCFQCHYALVRPPRSPDKLVFAQLNTNSIKDKFEMLSYKIKGNINVLMVSDTKINDSFPNENFLVDELSTNFD